jgi:hypothetical protein
VSGGKRSGGGISVIQVLASALAAVTSTVALSYLGVTGTVLGAALASVITVVGNFLYSRSLDRTHKAVKNIAHQAVTMVIPVAKDGGADAAQPASVSPSAAEGAKPLTAKPEPGSVEEVGGTGFGAGPKAATTTAALDAGGGPRDEEAHETDGESNGAERISGDVDSGAEDEGELVGEANGGSEPTSTSEPSEPLDESPDEQTGNWLKQMIARYGPWKALTALGLAVFLLIMAVVTVVEIGLGKPISDELTGRDSGRTGTFIHRQEQDPIAPAPTDQHQPVNPSTDPVTPEPPLPSTPGPSTETSSSSSASPSAPDPPDPSTSADTPDPNESGASTEPSPNPSASTDDGSGGEDDKANPPDGQEGEA